jgi:hypothetical protein
MIESIVEHTREDVKESAMSTADWIHERGRAALLLRQLAHRFGPLPQAVEAKVRAAEPQHLDDWALRLLTATSLTEALAEP